MRADLVVQQKEVNREKYKYYIHKVIGKMRADLVVQQKEVNREMYKYYIHKLREEYVSIISDICPYTHTT